jgi:glutamate carboxypeptidase
MNETNNTMRLRMTPSALKAGLLLALAAHCGGLGAAPVSHAALLEAARREQGPMLSSLEQMVNIESGSNDPAGLARMADYVERRLQALGARTERLAPAQGESRAVKGTLTGSGSKRLMLIAHMDTVFERGVLQKQPWRIDGGRAYGPGIADDKGGIAAILHVLKMLADAGWRDYASITVLIDPDEEIGSRGFRDLIASLAAEHDFVFSCEPTLGQDDGVLLGASGFAKVTMQVRGQASHAGVAPEKGRNALIELAHQITQTRDVAATVPGTRFSWTLANAGSVGNQIPDLASAAGDMRYNSLEAMRAVEAALHTRIVRTLVPDTRTTVVVEPGRPPFVATAAARAFAARGKAIYADTGRSLSLLDGTGGGTDAAYANRSGKAIVLESLGLVGAGIHSGDESIELAAIAPRLYLLARLMQEAGSGRQDAGAPASSLSK